MKWVYVEQERLNVLLLFVNQTDFGSIRLPAFPGRVFGVVAGCNHEMSKIRRLHTSAIRNVSQNEMKTFLRRFVALFKSCERSLRILRKMFLGCLCVCGIRIWDFEMKDFFPKKF